MCDIIIKHENLDIELQRCLGISNKILSSIMAKSFNKKHSENADISTSAIFDVDV